MTPIQEGKRTIVKYESSLLSVEKIRKATDAYVFSKKEFWKEIKAPPVKAQEHGETENKYWCCHTAIYLDYVMLYDMIDWEV